MSRISAAVFALLGAALVAAPAQAVFVGPCGLATCLLDPVDGDFGYGQFNFDYTVPPDGRTYRWLITFTSADPLATIFLDQPTQTEIHTTFRSSGGLDYGYDSHPSYLFSPTITPGRTSIRVRAPASFDFCSQPGPDGEICAADVNIWGNGTVLTLNSDEPVLATFSQTAVPEPATWAMLLIGFGMVGTAIRRAKQRPA